MPHLDLESKSSVMALATAAFTPFGPDGRISWETVELQAKHLQGWECPAVYVGGTAGEGASLTSGERRELLERWCTVAGPRMKVIAHVGHTSQAEAIVLARHAQQIGADAISAVPPYFHKPDNVEQLVDFLEPVAAAAPELPFVYYHIPGVTGVRIPASQILKTAARQLPTFAGIKFADSDVADLQRCMAVIDDQHQIYIGNAQLIMVAMQLGIRSAIGSVYNWAAPLYLQLIEHMAAGDTDAAWRCQWLAQRAIAAVSRPAGELPGFKAATSLRAVDCGWCRPPLATLDDRQRTSVADELRRIGFPDGSV